MQKKFVKNIFFLLAVNILVKPFGILVIEPAVQNTVGTAEYGLYNTLFSLSLLLNIFLDFGITNFNNRNISQNRHLVQKHLGSILSLRMVLSLVYILVTLTVAFCIRYHAVQFQMLILLCFNQVLLSTILYLRSNLAALQFFRTDSIISITDRILLILITGALLLFDKQDYKIEYFIYTQSVAYGVTLLITLIVLGKKAGTIKPRWNKAFNLMILKKSFPFALLILLMTFYNRIDVIMLERMLPLDGALQSGIYAQAYRLLEASNMIGYLFAVLLLPMFSHMLKNNNPVESLTKLSFTIVFIPVVAVVSICFFYNYKIMSMLYHNHVDQSSVILSIIMISLACICANYIFGTLLTANGNLKTLNRLAFMGMVVNIVLNAILIPIYKAKGAAIAGTLTQLCMAVAQLILVHRLFNFKTDVTLLLKFCILIVFAVGLSYASSLLTIPWILSAGMVFTAILLFAFLLQLFKLQQVKLLFRGDK